MIKTSETVSDLYAALAVAQGNMGVVVKDAANPHFRSRYASLGAVLDAVLPALNAQGIALLQHPHYAEGVVTVTTMLAHKSGQWMSSAVATRVGKDHAQGVGSAITYLRRYGAQSILGLPVEDDDGNAASRRRAAVQRTASTPSSQELKERRDKQAKVQLLRTLEQVELTVKDVDTWCEAHDRPTVARMTAHQRTSLRAWLVDGPGVKAIQSWHADQAGTDEGADPDDDVVVPEAR